jgi:GT2 family glycosyltransferase
VEAQAHALEGVVITVVDNGSTDGSIAAITSRFPNVRFLPLGANRGFTGGLASALAGSTARNVIFLNNDAIPETGWLEALTRSMEQAPEDVVSVGGRILSRDGALIDFIGGILTFDGHAFQPGFRFPAGTRPEPASGDAILFACGGNMISRRQPLMRLGGFDNDYFAYLEDVDFGWRTWLAGYRVLYEPAATVRHASSSTSDRLGNVERGVLFERNALQTAIKNYDDELLHDSAGAIFFTYLHRLHHYTTTRNAATSELRRGPFEGLLRASGGNSIWSRLKKKLRGAPTLATIDDPVTAMQFRALEWIVQNGDRLAAKRAAVQEMRRRSDQEIFQRFPLWFVPTYPGDDTLMSSALFQILRPRVPSINRKLSDIMRP